jgi:hypothetical protein
MPLRVEGSPTLNIVARTNDGRWSLERYDLSHSLSFQVTSFVNVKCQSFSTYIDIVDSIFEGRTSKNPTIFVSKFLCPKFSLKIRPVSNESTKEETVEIFDKLIYIVSIVYDHFFSHIKVSSGFCLFVCLFVSLVESIKQERNVYFFLSLVSVRHIEPCCKETHPQWPK